MFGRRKKVVEPAKISEANAILRQDAFNKAGDALRKLIVTLDRNEIVWSWDDFTNPPPQNQEQKPPQEAFKNELIKSWHILLSKLGCEDRIEEIILRVDQEIKKGQSK